MSIIATELPAATDITKAKFVAGIVAWVRGIKNSNVLASGELVDVYEDEVVYEHPSGEKLALRSYEDAQTTCFGSRLEIPDNAGRIWRTECVYTRFTDAAFLRVRGQCVATSYDAKVKTPKKPHIIRQAIDDGWVIPDGFLELKLEPNELADDVSLVAACINGDAVASLPVVYISRENQNLLPTDASLVARELAGIAHVVAEKDRAFSFDLMAATKRRNPYGGAIGVFSPAGEELFRLFRRPDDTLGKQLARILISRTTEYVSSLETKKAWDWQTLQEAQSRALRAKVVAGGSTAISDYVEAFDSELEAKDERIAALQTQLKMARNANSEQPTIGTNLFPKELKDKIGPELYEGEFSDRLRSFIQRSIKGPNEPKHSRTEQFARRFLEHTASSGRSAALTAQIKAACKDGNQMPKQLGALLTGFGFEKTQYGGHLKFRPPSQLFGLEIEVLPSTPSDSQRGGRNRGAEVIRHFGLGGLK
ncbi:MAG: hypothetical protein JKY00_14530 [Roseicyclus sp.]|nr:hypothetical protein [Roseicyclus sp.]